MLKVTIAAVMNTMAANTADRRQCFTTMATARSHSGVFSCATQAERPFWSRGSSMDTEGTFSPGFDLKLRPARLISSKFLLTVVSSTTLYFSELKIKNPTHTTQRFQTSTDDKPRVRWPPE